MADIVVKRLSGTRFQVRVVEGQTATDHEVTVSDSDLERYGGGAAPERLIEASFRFLLAREQKESILRSFPLAVIERYFPEYPTEIRRQL